MDTFTTQEGAIFDMEYARCPRCAAKSRLTDKGGAAGYFNCPECGVMYDEPTFDPAELAFVGTTDDCEIA